MKWSFSIVWQIRLRQLELPGPGFFCCSGCFFWFFCGFVHMRVSCKVPFPQPHPIPHRRAVDEIPHPYILFNTDFHLFLSLSGRKRIHQSPHVLNNPHSLSAHQWNPRNLLGFVPFHWGKSEIKFWGGVNGECVCVGPTVIFDEKNNLPEMSRFKQQTLFSSSVLDRIKTFQNNFAIEIWRCSVSGTMREGGRGSMHPLHVRQQTKT